jgi:ankyrin repeat protein
MKAVEAGLPQVVSLLLNHPEIQVHIRDDDGNSALIYAVIGGHEEVVGALLERSEGEEPTPDHIRKALHLARKSWKASSLPSQKSRLERVQQLLVSRLRGDKAARKSYPERALEERIELVNI